MSVENPEALAAQENGSNNQNGNGQLPNGLTNGHIFETNVLKLSSSSSNKHKSSSKDKYRDKERDKSDHKSSSTSNREKDKDRHRHKDKNKEKEKEKDKDRHKSSSHKSSNRDKDREKDRKDREYGKDREKEREKEKEKVDKDREKDKEKDREKDRHREKDKEREKDKNRERDKDRGEKDKPRTDKDKEKSRDKEKERKKEHSTPHREKDKEKTEKSIKEKDKDRHKNTSSSTKEKHSSGSSLKSKEKGHHSSKHREKEKHHSKEKDRHNKEKDREQETRSDEKENGEWIPEIKDSILMKVPEIPSNDCEQTCTGFIDMKPIIKVEKLDFSNHHIKSQFKGDFLNYSQASSCDYSMSQFRQDEPSFDIKEEMTDDSQDPLKPENDFEERDNEENVPLAKRKAGTEDSDDDVPLVSRKKVKTVKKEKKAKKKKRMHEESEEEVDIPHKKKKVKKEKESRSSNVEPTPPTKGRKKKEEETDEVWRWWEEEKREDGVKWNFLEHKGPVFAPEYEPLPKNVKFYYDRKEMKLSSDTEEVASFYAKMLNHDYVTKKVFNDNFFKDWRKFMTSKEKDVIRDLHKCNFNEMHAYYNAQSEKNKNRTKGEKLALKEANEKLIQEYGFCIIDGHKEKIGNFKLEPPGLFRGRGEHPKMGMVKRRLMPEDILINCSKTSKIPVPPKGHKWREVRHDNSVTWLASWTENVQGQAKYIMLNPSSKLKGEKDYQKYETARLLDKHIEKIRATYRDEWKSKEMRIRQRGVALYFIDKLALRAGNEKDEDQADTVGCCSLRVEHVSLKKEQDGKENVVIFDFLGKDSIRYYNEVEVEKRVFKNLELFMENKKEGDDLFDRLNTSVLNEHLRDLMDGLTAKVFRTYNASITLQRQLDLLTDPDATVPEKLLAYNRANRAVAVLCNHQRSVPKGHAKSMENLKEKIRQKRETIDDVQSEVYDLQKAAKRGSVKEKISLDKKKKQLERLKEQLKKLELQETDRDENKTIALGTSKLNYLDPRISIAWCKKHNVPIDKIFNKTQRDKFRWAIHMATEDYRF